MRRHLPGAAWRRARPQTCFSGPGGRPRTRCGDGGDTSGNPRRKQGECPVPPAADGPGAARLQWGRGSLWCEFTDHSTRSAALRRARATGRDSEDPGPCPTGRAPAPSFPCGNRETLLRPPGGGQTRTARAGPRPHLSPTLQASGSRRVTQGRARRGGRGPGARWDCPNWPLLSALAQPPHGGQAQPLSRGITEQTLPSKVPPPRGEPLGPRALQVHAHLCGGTRSRAWGLPRQLPWLEPFARFPVWSLRGQQEPPVGSGPGPPSALDRGCRGGFPATVHDQTWHF